VERGLVLSGQPRHHPKRRGPMATQIFDVPFYLCRSIYPLSQNYEVWRGNTCRGGACILGSATPPIPRVRSFSALQFWGSSVFMLHSSTQNDQIRHDNTYSRMSSPIGRNSLFCCSRFDVSLTDIARISKSLVWHCYRSRLTTSCRSTVSLLLELLSVKFGYFSISCPSKDDVAYAVDFICTWWLLLIS